MSKPKHTKLVIAVIIVSMTALVIGVSWRLYFQPYEFTGDYNVIDMNPNTFVFTSADIGQEVSIVHRLRNHGAIAGWQLWLTYDNAIVDFSHIEWGDIFDGYNEVPVFKDQGYRVEYGNMIFTLDEVPGVDPCCARTYYNDKSAGVAEFKYDISYPYSVQLLNKAGVRLTYHYDTDEVIPDLSVVFIILIMALSTFVLLNKKKWMKNV